MSKVFKSIAPIGGAVLGGFAGGPAGALLGGALGGALSGTGDVGSPPDIMGMAGAGGFSSNLQTPSFSFQNGTLSRASVTNPNRLTNSIDQLNAAQRDTGALRGNIAGLREQVRPGFGRLTEARVQAVRNAGAESIGNLRESMARRGVMGSSFANDAETRVRMATGQNEELARAEAFVDEMSLTLGLAQEDRAILGQQTAVINQRATQLQGLLDRELNELGMVGNIRNGLNSFISQQATAMAQLQMLQAQSNAQNQSSAAQLGVLGAGGLFSKGGPFATTRMF